MVCQSHMTHRRRIPGRKPSDSGSDDNDQPTERFRAVLLACSCCRLTRLSKIAQQGEDFAGREATVPAGSANTWQLARVRPSSDGFRVDSKDCRDLRWRHEPFVCGVDQLTPPELVSDRRNGARLAEGAESSEQSSTYQHPHYCEPPKQPAAQGKVPISGCRR